jgi:hypothetical protein
MSKSTMSKTAMILAAGLTLAVPAAAETLKPLQGPGERMVENVR